MLTLTSANIVSLGTPVEGREFTRYFSGFAITALDQEVLCLHKKQIELKRWKDVGSGVELFLCRTALDTEPLDTMAEFLAVCMTHGQLMIRNNILQWVQVHVPLTSQFLGKEDYFTQIVLALWQRGYIVVQSIIQTKEFPLIQWSITDPALLLQINEHSKHIENSLGTYIVPNIASEDRRDRTVEQLTNWCEENGYKTTMLDGYDIALIKCDS